MSAPDRATAPETPLQTIEMLLTKPIASAQFADGPGTNPRLVSVRFRDAPFDTTKYTFSIDASGRVAAIAILDRYEQGITLDFDYGADACSGP